MVGVRFAFCEIGGQIVGGRENMRGRKRENVLRKGKGLGGFLWDKLGGGCVEGTYFDEGVMYL